MHCLSPIPAVTLAPKAPLGRLLLLGYGQKPLHRLARSAPLADLDGLSSHGYRAQIHGAAAPLALQGAVQIPTDEQLCAPLD